VDVIVSSSPNFSKIKTRNFYYHGLNALLSGKRSEAFFYFVKMNWSEFKLRLFFACFLPLGIVEKK